MSWITTRTARLVMAALVCVVAAGCEDSGTSGPTGVTTTAQVQGTWNGDYTVTACNDQTAPGFCPEFVPVGTVLPIRIVLTQTGEQLSGTVELGSLIIPVSGTVNGSRVVLTGSVTMDVEGFSTTTALVNWDTVVSGSNMTGGWRTTFSIVGLPGSAFVENSIRTVTKTGQS